MPVLGVLLLVGLGAAPVVPQATREMVAVEMWYMAPRMVRTCKLINPRGAGHYDRALASWKARERTVVNAALSVIHKQRRPYATFDDVMKQVHGVVDQFESAPAGKQKEVCRNLLRTLEAERATSYTPAQLRAMAQSGKQPALFPPTVKTQSMPYQACTAKVRSLSAAAQPEFPTVSVVLANTLYTSKIWRRQEVITLTCRAADQKIVITTAKYR